MPGATPADAVRAFLEPLEAAVACLGHAKLVLTPGARGDVGRTHAWTLNGGSGLQLERGLVLKAGMHFECLDTGESRRDQRYRVSTRGYMYSVDGKPGELFAAHWHPQSKTSDAHFPHYHVGGPALSDTGVFLKRAHIPSPRFSFEGIVRMVIEQFNVTPRFPDWPERLAQSEETFKKHRHWE